MFFSFSLSYIWFPWPWFHTLSHFPWGRFLSSKKHALVGINTICRFVLHYLSTPVTVSGNRTRLAPPEPVKCRCSNYRPGSGPRGQSQRTWHPARPRSSSFVPLPISKPFLPEAPWRSTSQSGAHSDRGHPAQLPFDQSLLSEETLCPESPRVNSQQSQSKPPSLGFKNPGL